MYYLLVTKCDRLHAFYEDLQKDGVYYLAYTEDEEWAEIYAAQFEMKQYKVYYIEVSAKEIECIRRIWGLSITELIPFASESTGKVYIFSDGELQFMDDTLADGAETEFDDLLYCIENLKRFDCKRVNKVRKELEKIYKVVVEPETPEEEDAQQHLQDSIDWAEHYHFIAERMDLFKCNYNIFHTKPED